MNRIRVKICGITRAEDGTAAAYAGADAVGFVFYARSPRNVNTEQVARIIGELPPFISKVGLFVDAVAEEVRAVLGNVQLDMLQFHGTESPEYCSQFGKPWLKAIRMMPDIDLPNLEKLYAGASGLLLDSYVPGMPGGTGEAFGWDTLKSPLQKPVVLAGGLNPGNVLQAVDKVRPYAVDVSTGVESAPGIKDSRKMNEFINQVRMASSKIQ